MKSWMLAIVLTLVSVMGFSQRASAAGELNLFIWSEYIDQELVSRFERENHCKVNIALFETEDEALAKLQAGGVRQFDVVVIPNQIVEALIGLELIQRLDKSKVPNLSGVIDLFADPSYDPGSMHGAPYQWGTLGLMWDTSKVELAKAPSWGVLFDQSQRQGPYVLMDTTRDTLGVALLYLGHDMNATDAEQLKQAGKLVLDAKLASQCLGFDGSVGGQKKVLAGEAAIAMVYNGEALRAMEEKEGLAFAVPQEGSQVWVDCMVIPAQAPHADLAHAFINFILDPENNAQLSEYNLFATPVKETMTQLPQDVRDNGAIYPSEGVMSRLFFVEDLGAALKLWDEVWTAVKSR
jgi:spermidine/putrescine transport system substrate-binding protein